MGINIFLFLIQYTSQFDYDFFLFRLLGPLKCAWIKVEELY